MAKVTLTDVDKIYPGGVKAVDKFNLEIRDGEFVVLVGPSGCGKSTTLRMVAGLEEISAGKVRIGDEVVNDLPPKDRDIAMVFQNYALYPHMSVRDNMAFGLELRRFPKAEIDARMQEAARILGLGTLLGRKPKELSGGQRQRVAVGRAIVRKPAVFLFDEPLSNLDAKLRVQMRVEIKRLHHTLGATMIYVTHDQVEAMTMGERIVVMKDGIVQQVAEPMNLYDEPVNKFVAEFIGTPPMNFFEATVQNSAEGLRCEAGADLHFPVPEAARAALGAHLGKKVTVGLRPEDVMDPPTGAVGTLKARVEMVEPLGAESYIYFRSGETSFVGRFESHRRFKEGEDLSLVCRPGRVRFFDTATEKRLA
ncbi:MAG: sn-glycerol-3-phosphate ABC transporter ATP-binding protein UgpC [Spirochaetes bacterium]|nr:sn-glycerol-3-phosphate ABC transporter ATP-binding protein UgpC [Spirochaetota bacterium]